VHSAVVNESPIIESWQFNITSCRSAGGIEVKINAPLIRTLVGGSVVRFMLRQSLLLKK